MQWEGMLFPRWLVTDIMDLEAGVPGRGARDPGVTDPGVGVIDDVIISNLLLPFLLMNVGR